MNPLLNKEPVKRAENSIKEFDPNLKIICLEQTARTAQDAATALGCNVGAIVKSLLFSAGEDFVLCLVSGDKRCSLCYYKNIKIEAFLKTGHWFAMIGFINLVLPFFLIAYGVKSVQSNLSSYINVYYTIKFNILGHFYTKNEKFNLVKTFGILIGFSGIVFLFSDNILINENNFTSALLILLDQLVM